MHRKAFKDTFESHDGDDSDDSTASTSSTSTSTSSNGDGGKDIQSPASMHGSRQRIRCTRRALDVHKQIMDDLRECMPLDEECKDNLDGSSAPDTTGKERTREEKLIKRRVSSAISKIGSPSQGSHNQIGSFDRLLENVGLKEVENEASSGKRSNIRNDQFSCLANQVAHQFCEGSHNSSDCLRRLALATISYNTSHFLELVRSSANRNKAKHRRPHMVHVDFDRYLQDMRETDSQGDEATMQAISDVTGSSISVLNMASGCLSFAVEKYLPRELPQVPALLRHIVKAIHCRGRHFWLTYRQHRGYRSLQVSHFPGKYHQKEPVNKTRKVVAVNSSRGKYQKPKTRATGQELFREARVRGDTHVSLYQLVDDSWRCSSKSSRRKAAMNAARRICDFLQLENPQKTCTIELAQSSQNRNLEDTPSKKRRRCESSGASDSTMSEESLECIICTEHIAYNQYGVLDSCKHRYHYHCIMKWSKISNKCPICKETFSLIQRVCYPASGQTTVLDEAEIEPPPSLIENYVSVEWITAIDGSLVPAYNGYTREELEAACYVCNAGGDPCTLLLCDGRCGRGAHFPCVGLETIPEGEWYCEHCQSYLEGHRGQCSLRGGASTGSSSSRNRSNEVRYASSQRSDLSTLAST